MKTVFNRNGQLELELFDPVLLKNTHNLNEILTVAQKTKSSKIESTHILIALNKIPNGITQQIFRNYQLLPLELERGLINCIDVDSKSRPPERITVNNLAESAKNLANFLDHNFLNKTINLIDEGYLLLATLKNLTPAVIDNLNRVGITHANLIEDMEKLLKPSEPLQLFDGDTIRLESFSSGGCRVLELMKVEAEDLGYSEIDPRHLLLALLEVEGGATQTTLYDQNLFPKKIQEKIMLNLRARASKNRKQLLLNLNYINQSVVRILKQAAEQESKTDYSEKIYEVHILRAFLSIETFALRLLLDAGVDLKYTQNLAKQFKPDDEMVPTLISEKKSLAEITTAIQTDIVGQDDVIKMCLPFIRRLLFDFQRPGKPAGVLLFCGPSGSGKTEMAKSIARSVFGSEDNLIMLEMGQFQTKESMNIFVGAPPGYVGYGEGKLTNGLRDKPRSVVLFDEIEKAHPQVFDALLRFIDEGRIDDPAGPVRDGTECIIIMTSNVRTDDLTKLIEDGGTKKNKWEIRRKLKQALQNTTVKRDTDSTSQSTFYFRPEFLNRIDEIILFRGLIERDLTEIAQRYINDYIERLKREKQVSLNFGENQKMRSAAAKQIGYFCSTLDDGARAILRIVQNAVLDPVIDFINEHDCHPPISLGIQLIQDKNSEEPRGIVDYFEA